MKRYWELIRATVDEMSLRERAMIFAAAAFSVIALMDVALLEPLLSRQKILSSQVVQQHEQMNALQTQIQELMQASSADEHSPLHDHLLMLRRQINAQDNELQNRQSRLVDPGKMADLLKGVLNKNDSLQLIELKTLPVALVIDKPQAGNLSAPTTVDKLSADQNQTGLQKQIFKHGVSISVRGSYLDLTRYVTALEKMHAQLFWGGASLNVDQYPNSVLTLTVYTLSLDKTWMSI